MTLQTKPAVLDTALLKAQAKAFGIDDIGIIPIDRASLADQKTDILYLLPQAKSIISLVAKMDALPIQHPARSLANAEFKQTHHHIDALSHQLVKWLKSQGIQAISTPMGFPMEVSRLGNQPKSWLISHKPIAVEAGLGKMGIHRNVIHPTFGNFILLSSIVIDTPATDYDYPLDYNPCFECKLCVAACPVGAIGEDGSFSFSACLTHNYREFMGGFQDWAETLADSKNGLAYREKMPSNESASLWQSLSFGANYKAAYCMAVCPAGTDHLTTYEANKGEYLKRILNPLQHSVETLYVLENSDAQTHAAKRFPHKPQKIVRMGIYPQTLQGFFSALPLVFQRNRAKGIQATLHFTFRGQEIGDWTLAIANQEIQISEGHRGNASTHIHVDTKTWLKIANRARHPFWAILSGKMRVRGSLKGLQDFTHCIAT